MSSLPYVPRHAGKPVRCQHCERDIEQLAGGTWVDSDGIPVCLKYTGLPPARQQSYVYHTPMPQIVKDST